jgi:hypothetical protein
MPHVNSWKKPALLAAAAGLVGGGLLAIAVPAHAIPPAPLAPAKCEQWVFPGFTKINLTKGSLTFVSNESTVNGVATTFELGDGKSSQETMSGGITPDNHIDLLMPVGADATYHVLGDVGADGKVSNGRMGIPLGNELANAQPATIPALKCAKQATNGTPEGANSQMVTVLKDSDVYDTPEGNRLEAPFFLPKDHQYASVKPCADNWCLLNIPELPGGAHGGLPAGQAWVYSGEGYLDVK